LDGHHENWYAFGGSAPGVTIQFLTVQNFGFACDNNNEGVVNHDSAEGWTVESSTVRNNAGAVVMLGSENRLVNNCLRNDCRWKTQNLRIEGNIFQTDASHIRLCVHSLGCGFNGLISNYGT
jgi:hypothetical protein